MKKKGLCEALFHRCNHKLPWKTQTTQVFLCFIIPSFHLFVLGGLLILMKKKSLCEA